MPLAHAVRLAAALLLLALPAAPPARAQAEPAVEALREAGRLARGGNWEGALAAAERGGPVAAAVLRWQSLREEGDWSFLDYAAFVADHPDWPALDEVRRNGERAILPGTPPRAVLAFFGGDGGEVGAPLTGQGARALAEALSALGRAEEAEAVVLAAWRTLTLTERGQAALLEGFADLLAPHHRARAEAMLWARRRDDAERMLPLLPDEARALVRARLSLQRGGDPDVVLDALPAGLRGDPGLAFDRFARLVEDGDLSDALAVAAPREGTAEALGEPARWGAGRAQVARWLMREGRAEEAYRLASRHGMTEGDAYADLEWLSGYLSLRYLGEPERARGHFRDSEAAVRGPVSLSRAAYWTGRALDELGRGDEARAAYARAARFQTAFYGLLAAERIGLPLDPALAGREGADGWQAEGSAMSGEQGQAMLMLLAAGQREDALLFARHLARTLDREGVAELGHLLEALHEPHIAVLAGKAAAERGLAVANTAFPLHPLAYGDWPVEADLALAIARRESEFRPDVSSPVGAQGLMQLMPGTAREVAGWLGVPYAPARLGEWEYNARLGTRYLRHLQDTFGTSPVLVAAGYNAGPGRLRQWMAERGDPRLPGVDVVDWIEHIPFAETRTYVMRVAESIPVYRARLGGGTGPVRFTALLKGERPLVRPVARPREADPADVAAAAREADGAHLATLAAAAEVAAPPAPTPLRPLARPAASSAGL